MRNRLFNKKSKKAMVFNIMIVIFTIMILSYAYIRLTEKMDKVTLEIGENQMKIITEVQEGEKALIFLDFAAKMALYQAAYDLPSSGGFSGTSSCGTYYDFNMWNDNSKTDCSINESTARLALQTLFASSLKSRVAAYPTADFIERTSASALARGQAIASGYFGSVAAPPPDVITGDAILDYAQCYEGRKYGTGAGEFVCTTFVIKVLQDLGVELDSEMMGIINVRVSKKAEEAGMSKDEYAATSGDPIGKGVQLALVSRGLGKEVSVDEIQKGDFVQYWWKKTDGWKGHAVIVKEVNDDGTVDTYGAHWTTVTTATGIDLKDPEKNVYAVRLNPDANKGPSAKGSTAATSSSTTAPPATQDPKPGATAPATDTTAQTAPVEICKKPEFLSDQLYDFVLNSSGGRTDVIGIARQNLAVGISKLPSILGETVSCVPMHADKEYDLEYFKSTYGRTRLEVESRLKKLNFMGKEVKVHELIAPVIGCIERTIRSCEEGRNYWFRDIKSYDWQTVDPVTQLMATSSFGISLSINADSNINSKDGRLRTDLPDCVVDAFKNNGFKWGGDFSKEKVPSLFMFMADPARLAVQSFAAGKGMVPAETFTCNYCGPKGRETLMTINPSAYSSCPAVKRGSGCCKAACPQGAVIRDQMPYIGQCSAEDMGPGSDCLSGTSYCESACGIAASRMAFRSYGIEITSQEMFCGGPNSVIATGGSSIFKIADLSRRIGLAETRNNPGGVFDWNDVVNSVRSGKVVVLSVSDFRGTPYDPGMIDKSGKTAAQIKEEKEAMLAAGKKYASDLNERCFNTKGHYLTVYGAGDNYVIINDPYNAACPNSVERIVLSREYLERTSKHYVVMS
ncbi:MAG: M15 family metallopeptidase [Candidatus Woesearchaeota archaeon]